MIIDWSRRPASSCCCYRSQGLIYHQTGRNGHERFGVGGDEGGGEAVAVVCVCVVVELCVVWVCGWWRPLPPPKPETVVDGRARGKSLTGRKVLREPRP